MLAPKEGGAPCTLKIALENLIQRLLEGIVTFLDALSSVSQEFISSCSLCFNGVELSLLNMILCFFSYYWLEFIFTVQHFESEVFPRCLWCLSSFVEENATSSCRAGGLFSKPTPLQRMMLSDRMIFLQLLLQHFCYKDVKDNMEEKRNRFRVLGQQNTQPDKES